MANSVISSKTPAQETLLTPRFYTTDFEEMANLDVSSNYEEIESILEEFRKDYNQRHFIRDKEFSQIPGKQKLLHFFYNCYSSMFGSGASIALTPVQQVHHYS